MATINKKALLSDDRLKGAFDLFDKVILFMMLSILLNRMAVVQFQLMRLNKF